MTETPAVVHIASIVVEPDPRQPDGVTSVTFTSIPTGYGYLSLRATIPFPDQGLHLGGVGESFTVFSIQHVTGRDAEHPTVAAALAKTTIWQAHMSWAPQITVMPRGTDGHFPTGSRFLLFGH